VSDADALEKYLRIFGYEDDVCICGMEKLISKWVRLIEMKIYIWWDRCNIVR
jgi:hypothetical protein